MITAKKYLVYCVNFLLGSFLAWYAWVFLVRNYNVVEPAGDLAEFMNNPLRILHGDMPYKDFWLLFPPGEALFPALLYKVFGISINVVLVLYSASIILMGITGFLMAKILLRNTTGALVIAFLLIIAGNPDVYFLPQLILALFLLQYFKTPRWGWLVAAGLAGGCGLLFRLYHVAPVIIASLLAIGFYEKEWRYRIRQLIIYSGSIIIVIIPFIIYYSSFFFIAFYAVFIDSISHNGATSVPYFHTLGVDLAAIKQFKDFVLRGFQPQARLNLFYLYLTVAYHTLIYLLPVITLSLAFLFYKQWKELNYIDKTAIIFFVTWSVLFFPYALVRGEANRVMHILPPYYFVLLFLLLKGPRNKGLFLILNKLVFGIFAFLIARNALQIYNWRSAYSLPKYTVATKYGTFKTIDKNKAMNDARLLNYITDNTTPDDYIFSTAWDGLPVYLLTGRRNPTYYDSMIDVIVRPTDGKQQRIIDQLEKHQTKLIILEPGLMYDRMPSRSYVHNCKLLDGFVHSHYTFKKEFEDYQIFELNK